MYLGQGECIEWQGPMAGQYWDQSGMSPPITESAQALHKYDSAHHRFADTSSKSKLYRNVFGIYLHTNFQKINFSCKEIILPRAREKKAG